MAEEGNDVRPIEDVMDEVYQNINKTIEDRYFAPYREKLGQLEQNQLVVEARKLGVDSDVLGKMDDTLTREECYKKLDMLKDEASSRFLYNPLEYLGV
jgi:exopolysaccharide biosynthesis predicted pyruvyltransferase EpsI